MMISSNGSLVVNISSASVEERQGEAQDFVRWVTMSQFHNVTKSQCHNVTMSQCHQIGTNRPYYWNNSLSWKNFGTKATLIVFSLFLLSNWYSDNLKPGGVGQNRPNFLAPSRKIGRKIENSPYNSFVLSK